MARPGGDHRAAATAAWPHDWSASNSASDTAEARQVLHVGETVRDQESVKTGDDEMRGTWPYETVRLLEQWAAWLANDRKPVSTISPYPAYRLSGRGKRDGNVIPILGVEAEKADRIISAMMPRHQQPLRLHYGWKETTRSDRNKALACNCCVNTYKARLEEAHAAFQRAWYSGREAVTLTF